MQPHLAKWVTDEIIQAISEVMAKYNLKCVQTEQASYCDICDDTVEVFEHWHFQANQYKIKMEDVFKALMPIEYGKVKK